MGTPTEGIPPERVPPPRHAVREGIPPRPPTSLSPSRAADFMRCPLLYRLRVIDRLPERPSEAATRGTVVHAVLERLFDAPAAERTADRARSMVPGEWERLRAARPELAALFDAADPAALTTWLESAQRLVDRWFTLEDPTRLEPAERELYVETVLESGLTLRGYVDRLDVAPATGDLRVVDYKTGKAPRPEYADEPLFQMKFYALVLRRLRGVVPRRLQLVYLGSGDVLTYDPTEADLRLTERRLLALWRSIRAATESGDWRPRRTPLCGWCDHQAFCPEFGGTPPPYPLAETAGSPPGLGENGAV
ncbi:RecB family exonuclease [Streptomyces sp.]|uniref:RecB family exonuclease n=1 Tax=Streptomyces sp. TaxID=1931 RepID=UPI002F4207B1